MTSQVKPHMKPWLTEAVLTEVMHERRRQHKKWGEQNHPSGTGPDVEIVVSEGHRQPAWIADKNAKVYTDVAAKDGTLTWRHILLEEVFEALAEDDPAALRTELQQVAAVAVAWMECLDREGKKA